MFMMVVYDQFIRTSIISLDICYIQPNTSFDERNAITSHFLTELEFELWSHIVAESAFS